MSAGVVAKIGYTTVLGTILALVAGFLSLSPIAGAAAAGATREMRVAVDGVAQDKASFRARVGLTLQALDRVSEVAEQMSPEHAADLDPVLVQLAQDSMQVLDDVNQARTTADLAHASKKMVAIESSTDNLLQAVQELIEPEMSL